jgi:hypothetical protein
MASLRIALGLVLAPCLLLASGVHAAPAGDACQAARLKAAARYYGAALKCAGKSMGSTRDPRACFEKAQARLFAAHEGAESAGGCIGRPGEMADLVFDQVEELLVGYVPPKVVFRSSSLFSGDLGGLEGADRICQEHAAAGGLEGRFVALISTSEVDARSRVPYAPGGLARPDGVLVATNADDLFDGAILASINVTEDGTAIAGNTETWTGSNASGSASSSCNDWTSSSGASLGINGHSGDTDSSWIRAYLQFCNRTNVALYCVEQ